MFNSTNSVTSKLVDIPYGYKFSQSISKISGFSRIVYTSSAKFNPVLHLRTWSKNIRMCVCMRFVACLVETMDDDLDCIPGGTGVRWMNLLGVVPAPTNDAGSTAELPPREDRTGELQRGGPCRGPCLPLADALPIYGVTFATSMHYWSRGKRWHSLYTREN